MNIHFWLVTAFKLIYTISRLDRDNATSSIEGFHRFSLVESKSQLICQERFNKANFSFEKLPTWINIQHFLWTDTITKKASSIAANVKGEESDHPYLQKKHELQKKLHQNLCHEFIKHVGQYRPTQSSGSKILPSGRNHVDRVIRSILSFWRLEEFKPSSWMAWAADLVENFYNESPLALSRVLLRTWEKWHQPIQYSSSSTRRTSKTAYFNRLKTLTRISDGVCDMHIPKLFEGLLLGWKGGTARWFLVYVLILSLQPLGEEWLYGVYHNPPSIGWMTSTTVRSSCVNRW